MPINLKTINWEPYFKHPTKIKQLTKQFKLAQTTLPDLLNDPQIVTNWYQYRYLVQISLIDKLPSQIITQLKKEFEKQNLGFQLPSASIVFADTSLNQTQIKHFTKIYTNWLLKIDPHFQTKLIPASQNYIHCHLKDYTMNNLEALHQFKITGKMVSHNSFTIVKAFAQQKPHAKLHAQHLRNVDELVKIKRFQKLLERHCQKSLQTKCPTILDPQFVRLLQSYSQF